MFWNWFWLIFAALAALVANHFLLESPELTRQAAFMAGIFLLAAILWTSEAIPLFATALLIVGLETLLLANPGNWQGLGFSTGVNPSFTEVFHWAADPVLLLFFGGFLLAEAAVVTGLDQSMSAWLIKPFGNKPRMVLLGIMVVTATFSMWMSNTATTAMMMALVVPVLDQVPSGDRFRKALVLAIPFAANIGGLGTPISSPPNAVALGFLRKLGYSIDFLEWLLVAFPLMVGMLLFAWLLIGSYFRTSTQQLSIQLPKKEISSKGWFVVVIFSLTVLLWLSDKWHGLPPSVVALLPVVSLTAGRILSARDLMKIDWPVLILIGGGIALGTGMDKTDLDQWIVTQLPLSGENLMLLFGVLVAATMILSTFMSNTAAANLLLPIGVSSALALGLSSGTALIQAAFSIALAASLSMMLPVSTPPNAIAYYHGEFSKKEMAILGAVIGLVGGSLIVIFGGWVIRLWNIG